MLCLLVLSSFSNLYTSIHVHAVDAADADVVVVEVRWWLYQHKRLQTLEPISHHIAPIIFFFIFISPFF